MSPPKQDGRPPSLRQGTRPAAVGARLRGGTAHLLSPQSRQQLRRGSPHPLLAHSRSLNSWTRASPIRKARRRPRRPTCSKPFRPELYVTSDEFTRCPVDQKTWGDSQREEGQTTLPVRAATIGVPARLRCRSGMTWETSALPDLLNLYSLLVSKASSAEYVFVKNIYFRLSRVNGFIDSSPARSQSREAA